MTTARDEFPSDLVVDGCRRPGLLKGVRRVVSIATTAEAGPESMQELPQECEGLTDGDGVEVQWLGRA